MRALLLPFWWLLVGSVWAAGSSTNDTSPQCQPKACQRDGDSERPACGSDGLTYPNRCHLERARCKDPSVKVEKRGECRRQRPCPQWAELSGNSSSSSGGRFVAACRPDGTYDAAQCHPATGYCWCVTPDGVPLPYTAVKWRRDKKPRCGRKKYKRGSPSRKHKTRICKQSDKAVLNSNLIHSFQSEYIRAVGRNDSDVAVVRWKFASLDADGSSTLNKAETRELQKVAKKAMRPKKCARDFPVACDTDGDQVLLLREWEECLSKDGMTEGEPGSDRRSPSSEDDDEEEDDSSATFHIGMRTPPARVLIPGSAVAVGQNYDNDSSDVREEDPPDCSSDRSAALADKANQLYIPECTPDGRYQKVQCIKSANYCFCVHEDTGKTVAGTTVSKGDAPKCDIAAPPQRVMRGCPDTKRTAFTRDLLKLLRKRMADHAPGAGTTTFDSLQWMDSKDEQTATWSFVVFDTNKNKVLERNEWKAFKEMVSSVKGLKKCGRKLPRYCDSNKDRQITMTEWKECLSIQQAPRLVSGSSPRAGKTNPLSLLKDD